MRFLIPFSDIWAMEYQCQLQGSILCSPSLPGCSSKRDAPSVAVAMLCVPRSAFSFTLADLSLSRLFLCYLGLDWAAFSASYSLWDYVLQHGGYLRLSRF